MKPYTERQMQAARAIALVADAVQIGLLPLFAEGGLSPANMALDVIVAGIMYSLIGFHIAFLPTFLVEEVPVLNLAPTWTLAVLLATRNGATALESVQATAQALPATQRALPAAAR